MAGVLCGMRNSCHATCCRLGLPAGAGVAGIAVVGAGVVGAGVAGAAVVGATVVIGAAVVGATVVIGAGVVGAGVARGQSTTSRYQKRDEVKAEVVGFWEIPGCLV